MIFENLKEVSKDKIAIKYLERVLTYDALTLEIKKRAAALSVLKKDLVLCHTDELENLLNFLAAMFIGKKAVFAGKQFQHIQSVFDVTTFDFVHQLNYTDSEVCQIKPSDKDIFLGVLSGGSTASPKIIWKDYQSWFSAFPYQSQVFGISDSDSVFVLDALAYSANLNSVLHAIWQGATVLLGRLQDASQWTMQFEEEHVSSVFLVPSHYRLLVASGGKMAGIKSLVSAREKLHLSTAEQLIAKCPNAVLTEYYGASELGHVSFQQNQDIVNNPASLGKAFPGVDISIKNDKIFVESSYVSPEYRNSPTVFDLGFIDADGLLFVLGREGRMFNKRGLNIFAEEIENKALLFQAIKEAVLIENLNHLGKPKLELLVVCKAKIELNKKELREFLLTVLPPQKLPNKITQVAELPRTLAGKIDFKAFSKRPVEEEHADA